MFSSLFSRRRPHELPLLRSYYVQSPQNRVSLLLASKAISYSINTAGCVASLEDLGYAHLRFSQPAITANEDIPRVIATIFSDLFSKQEVDAKHKGNAILCGLCSELLTLDFNLQMSSLCLDRRRLLQIVSMITNQKYAMVSDSARTALENIQVVLISNPDFEALRFALTALLKPSVPEFATSLRLQKRVEQLSGEVYWHWAASGFNAHSLLFNKKIGDFASSPPIEASDKTSSTYNLPLLAGNAVRAASTAYAANAEANAKPSVDLALEQPAQGQVARETARRDAVSTFQKLDALCEEQLFALFYGALLRNPSLVSQHHLISEARRLCPEALDLAYRQAWERHRQIIAQYTVKE